MAKAILMMNMPGNCHECPVRYYDIMRNISHCYITGNIILDDADKLDWCPLIKLPDRKPDRQMLFSGKSYTLEDISDAFELGEDTGWNAFIDYLEEKGNG